MPRVPGPPAYYHDVLTIAQTAVGRLIQNPSMSVAAWYHQKAKQCAQLAKDAIEPRQRSDFETERKLWLQIAEKIERDETALIGTSPSAAPPTMWTEF